MGAGRLRRTTSTCRVGGCLVAAVLLVAACTGGTSDDSPADSPRTSSTTGGAHVGMRATVVQQRTDIGTTRIGLEVTTDRRTTVHVNGAQLLTEAFEQRPITVKDTDFAPGRTIDLTVDYGTPVCTPGVSVDDAQVLVRYAVDGGDETVTLPVAKLGRDLLADLHAGDCASQRLDEAAAISYDTPFRREVVDGSRSLAGDLVLRRPAVDGSGERVVVESVFGSVLLQFLGRHQETGASLGVLEPGQSTTRVPVLIRGNNRCDPHERSASQQTFVFTIDVRVGSSPLHREIIEPPTGLRVQAMALLDDVC